MSCSVKTWPIPSCKYGSCINQTCVCNDGYITNDLFFETTNCFQLGYVKLVFAICGFLATFIVAVILTQRLIGFKFDLRLRPALTLFLMWIQYWGSVVVCAVVSTISYLSMHDGHQHSIDILRVVGFVFWIVFNAGLYYGTVYMLVSAGGIAAVIVKTSGHDFVKVMTKKLLIFNSVGFVLACIFSFLGFFAVGDAQFWFVRGMFFFQMLSIMCWAIIAAVIAKQYRKFLREKTKLNRATNERIAALDKIISDATGSAFIVCLISTCQIVFVLYWDMFTMFSLVVTALTDGQWFYEVSAKNIGSTTSNRSSNITKPSQM
eukprot:TRINITY_DN10301_c0_g1_i1.p1 TRINITY_DN10301_c0_g1~~TRINITY_DN10301_c0_g1_i1.p1  ORF type:complete len:319 (-),score=10.15 TRINITY_DN10301_c0_g1_i1:188-1144(-)